MQKHYSRFLQAAIVFPSLTLHLVLSPVVGAAATGLPSAAAISPDQTRTLASVVADNQQSDTDLEAAKVDAFFAKYGRTQIAGYGREIVEAAEKNGLPPLAVAGVIQVESSGYANACPNDPNNGMGYNSCHDTDFSSIDQAIDTVAATIGGNDPDTAKYYADKTFDQRLEVYNGESYDGGSVNPHYVRNVNWVMDQIDQMQVAQPSLADALDTKA